MLKKLSFCILLLLNSMRSLAGIEEDILLAKQEHIKKMRRIEEREKTAKEKLESKKRKILAHKEKEIRLKPLRKPFKKTFACIMELASYREGFPISIKNAIKLALENKIYIENNGYLFDQSIEEKCNSTLRNMKTLHAEKEVLNSYWNSYEQDLKSETNNNPSVDFFLNTIREYAFAEPRYCKMRGLSVSAGLFLGIRLSPYLGSCKDRFGRKYIMIGAEQGQSLAAGASLSVFSKQGKYSQSAHRIGGRSPNYSGFWEITFGIGIHEYEEEKYGGEKSSFDLGLIVTGREESGEIFKLFKVKEGNPYKLMEILGL